MDKVLTKSKLLFSYLAIFLITLVLFYIFLNTNTILLKNLGFTMIFSSLVFLLSFYYNNTECVDFEWGTLGLCLVIINLQKVELDFIKLLYYTPALLLIVVYSSRHVFIYLRNFHNLKRETINFRYKEMEENFGDNKVSYWVFNYFNLHLVPTLVLTMVYYPIFELLDTLFKEKPSVKVSLLIFGYMVGYFGILCSSIADEHLNVFRHTKNKIDKVLQDGLWSIVRHPNYLGEIMFYFGLLLVNFSFTHRIGLNCLGMILMTAIFVFYSAPVMDKHMLKGYGDDYKSYMAKTKYKLIPYIN
jgi:steroid 5-alpha reductase family enzyme